uniref:ORF29 n=1 Tax=Nitrosopumilaceae spindle-shaped virus TaxID=3065433 RepID=A0AAT9JG90_9VIRU
MPVMFPQKVLQEEVCEQQLPVQKIYNQGRKETSGKGLGLVCTV